MEAKKLERKIEDWAASLGFFLPTDSASSQNYFAPLTATPNRRQLWKVIIDSVQTRKNVQEMRKKLLVFQLKNGKKNSVVNCKSAASNIDLWNSQNKMEADIAEDRKANSELEKQILTKASDLMLDICKLAKLERHCEEFKEKTLILRLLSKKGKLYAEELAQMLRKVPKNYDIRPEGTDVKEILVKFKNEIFKSQCYTPCFEESEVLEQLKELYKSNGSEKPIWEILFTHKKERLENFAKFIEKLSTVDKNALREKDAAIEETMKSATMKLKQETIEKSLQVMVNEVESQLLNLEIKKLTEKLESILLFSNSEGSYTENSFAFEEEGVANDSFSDKRKLLVEIQKQAELCGRKRQIEFLNAELNLLEIEILKKKDVKINQDFNGEEELQKLFETIRLSLDEIKFILSEQEKQKSEIIQMQNKMKNLLEEIVEESEDENFIKNVQETVDKLKINLDRQTEAFLELPLEASRMAENNLTENSREFLEHYLNNYGGEFKNFFKTMLIQPQQNVDVILNLIEKRKKAVEEITKFICERERLSDSQKQIYARLKGIKYDAQLCEENYKQCDEILSRIQHKATELHSDIEFAQNVLQNWIEQPYRLMIRDTETVKGLTLKEYEELYRNAKKRDETSCSSAQKQ